MIPPGGTIGILGGGQLGRMLAMAAARLGLKSAIYAPEKNSPAFDVAASHVVADYADHDALEKFARAVDVVTYEFENVPGDAASVLSALKSVRPNPKALTVIQDRFAEKSFARNLAIATAPFALITSDETLQAALKEIGTPSVLKTARLGYDGKGQRIVRASDQLAGAWSELKRVPCILEGFVNFTRELSVVAARGTDGKIACFDLVENRHENHILRKTLAPARAPQRVKAQATQIASQLLTAFDYVGVMAVEMFETRDGRLLVNEVAPRVHNSGHWTIDGCATSQFEQHIRAVCGWPLGDATRHSDAVMTNLLGNDVADWQTLAATPASALHLYGKKEAREGRKMGHHTRLYPLGTRPDG